MKRFLLLTRHFFGRFFDNELVSRDSEMRVTVTQILALLAVPSIFAPFYLQPRYVRLHFLPEEIREAQRQMTLSSDRFLFVALAMVVMGIVATLQWDALFPDRSDFRILIPLPLTARTLFAAKLASLIIFVLLFSADVNALSSILFPAVSLERGTLANFFSVASIHAAVVTAATASVFFAIVGLQGLLMNLLPIRTFLRVSPYVQLVLICAFLVLLLMIPSISSSLDLWRKSEAPILYWIPPIWFLALYESWLGAAGAHISTFADLATKAFWGVTGFMLAVYALSYGRHIRRSLESVTTSDSAPTIFGSAAARLLDRHMLRHPVERASCYFIGKTLLRSRKHTVFLAAYVGVGLAFVLEGLIGAATTGFAIFRPTIATLSIPLVILFFLLSGLRVIFTVPAELKANWAFRLAEGEQRRCCLMGIRKALAIFAVAPVLIAATPFYVVLLGWRQGALHLLFTLALTWILLEALLVNFMKIPFTCSYRPGRANITLTFALYWLAFTAYAYSMTALEIWLLKDGARLIIFFAAAAFVLISLIRYRNHVLALNLPLIYDDEPDPVVRTLNIDMAAERTVRPA